MPQTRSASFDPLTLAIKLGIRPQTVDDDSEGEAYGSDNEIPLNEMMLKDVVPGTPSTISSGSTLSDDHSARSELLDPDGGVYMINLNVEIKPNMAHTERALEATKVVLDLIQTEDKSAQWVAKSTVAGKTLPNLKSSKDKNYPDGATAFAVIPNLPTSLHKALVKPEIPALVAQ